MNLKGLRIGYVPYSKNLDRPGDRRRFCFYAEKRNIDFEIAQPSENYDVVIVAGPGDLAFWSEYGNKNRKVIFELIDSYLAIPKSDLKGQLRGLARFVTRKDRKFQPDYWKSLQIMCQRADAVVCSTEEQKKDLLNFCPNVHIILDVHSGVIRSIKNDYSAGEVVNLVWEGLGNNVHTLLEISDVLNKLNRKYKIALHLFTDIEYNLYMNKFVKRSNLTLAKNIFHNTYLYQWNSLLASRIITGCDLAIIPLPLNNPLMSGKPENKLLLFWRMAMPTIVSATPAYTRVMDQAGLPMACQTKQEWEATLEKYIIDQAAREEAGKIGKAFVEDHYSENQILMQWDDLFTSVIG